MTYGATRAAPTIGPPSTAVVGYSYAYTTASSAAANPVTGIVMDIDVDTPGIASPGSGHFAWDWWGVAATASNGATIEVGYMLVRDGTSVWGPLPFYLNATGQVEAACGVGFSPGQQQFRADLTPGTSNWTFSAGGLTIIGPQFNWQEPNPCTGPMTTGVVDIGAPTADGNSILTAAGEGSEVASQRFWSMPVVQVEHAMSANYTSGWGLIPFALAGRSGSPGIGVAGQRQNASLAPDALEFGTTIAWPGNNFALWAPTLNVTAQGGPISGTAPLTVAFSAIATGGTGNYSNYSWNFGDSRFGGLASTSHTYASAGTFLAAVTVTDSGEEQNVSETIWINVTWPALSVTATGNASHGVLPLAIAFAAIASGGSGSYVSFNWTFGDGTNGIGAAINHTYAHAGNFTAFVTVRDTNGTTARSGEINVTVVAPSPSPGSPVSSGGGGLLNGYLLAIVGVLAILVVAAAAAVLLRRRKTQPPAQPSR
jgi:hypothetical protein